MAYDSMVSVHKGTVGIVNLFKAGYNFQNLPPTNSVEFAKQIAFEM